MQNVLVTGATRGLGQMLALRLVDEGYRVIGTGRGNTPPSDWPALEKLIYASLDLEDTDFHSFILNLQETHGPLYALVNNAASGLGRVLATMHESEITKLVAVNLTSTILLTKYAIRSMLLQETGRVVNVASVIATTGFKGLSVYGATKAGLLGFTQSLAREVGAAGITVNSVSPGFMETEMTSGMGSADLERIRRRSPMKRLITPNDVAGVIKLLLSEEGANITGVDIKIDAGSSV
ncbi:MAG: 3-oxoacyl-[acyl-carrier protein] reductase [Verrucomicrobiales bacterium]|jgi:3-oxoacyl-[acyl-carrier protein] reductase